VPTKSGLLFAGDAHGNLLVLDATNGSLLKRIDAGGALNNGLISYAVEGAQSPLQWRTRTPVTGALSIPHLVRIEFYDINNNQPAFTG
jgi:hypothetical protein